MAEHRLVSTVYPQHFYSTHCLRVDLLTKKFVVRLDHDEQQRGLTWESSAQDYIGHSHRLLLLEQGLWKRQTKVGSQAMLPGRSIDLDAPS